MSKPSATVYVVDDDASVLKSVGRVLRSAGFGVETFPSGQAFLAHPLAPGPSCVVLDVRMPGFTGLELQAALSARKEPVAIVFISGAADVPVSVRAMKAGAVDFLSKPFDESELLGAITQALERDRRRWEDRQRHAGSA